MTVLQNFFAATAPVPATIIDCRQDRQGNWKLFDLNLKPNMTGTGQSGRDEQDSLTMLDSRAVGWTYPERVVHLFQQAWTVR